jgi:hypothetical protein
MIISLSLTELCYLAFTIATASRNFIFFASGLPDSDWRNSTDDFSVLGISVDTPF